MRSAPLILAVCAAGAAGAARAADWSISSFFSQRVEATTDLNLDDSRNEDDPALGSITDLGVSFEGRGQNFRLVAAPGVRGAFYTDENVDLNRVAPRFNGSFDYDAPRHGVTATLSIIPQTTTESQFEDTGVVEADVLEIVANGSLGATYEVDPRSQIGLTGFFRIREFTSSPDTLTPTRSVGFDATWRREMTARTRGGLAFGVERFLADDPDGDRRSWVYSASADVERDVTERFAAGARLGLSLIDTEDDAPGVDDDQAIGFVGAVDATYRTADTVYQIALSQDVDQNSFGDIESVTALSASANHRIDARQSVGLTMRLAAQTPFFDATADDRSNRNTFSLAPSYRIALTRRWEAAVGYTFRAENSDASDLDTSHLAFVQLSRNFSILP